MNRKLRGLCIWALSASFAALAGCDTSPNPDFEQALKDQQASKAGDPYLPLTNNVPREGSYLRIEAGLRQSYASQQALSIRSAYAGVLKKLDADPKVAVAGDLLTHCREPFNEVLAFHDDDTADAQTAATSGATVFDHLNACRNAALVAAESGNDDMKEAAGVLRRFASTGMVITSLTIIAQENETAGLEMWRRADALMQEDRPGFKFRPQQLLNR